MSLTVIETDAEGKLSAVLVLNGVEPDFATVDPFREIELRGLLDPPAEAGWAFTLRKLVDDANWLIWRRTLADWGGTAEELLAALQAHLRGRPLENTDEVLTAIGSGA